MMFPQSNIMCRGREPCCRYEGKCKYLQYSVIGLCTTFHMSLQQDTFQERVDIEIYVYTSFGACIEPLQMLRLVSSKMMVSCLNVCITETVPTVLFCKHTVYAIECVYSDSKKKDSILLSAYTVQAYTCI